MQAARTHTRTQGLLHDGLLPFPSRSFHSLGSPAPWLCGANALAAPSWKQSAIRLLNQPSTPLCTTTTRVAAARTPGPQGSVPPFCSCQWIFIRAMEPCTCLHSVAHLFLQPFFLFSFPCLSHTHTHAHKRKRKCTRTLSIIATHAAVPLARVPSVKLTPRPHQAAAMLQRSGALASHCGAPGPPPALVGVPG